MLNLNHKGLIYCGSMIIALLFSGCDSSKQANNDSAVIVDIPQINEVVNLIESISPNGELSFYSPEQSLSVFSSHNSKCSYQDVTEVDDVHFFSEQLNTIHEAIVFVLPNKEYNYEISCDSLVNNVSYTERQNMFFATAEATTEDPTIVKIEKSENDNVVLIGFNFGELAETEPFIFNDFEEGRNTEIISDGWGLFRDNSKGPFYTSEESYSGNLSIMNKVFKGSGTEFNTAWKEYPAIEEVYLSYRFMFKVKQGAGLIKLARLTSDYEGKISNVNHYNGPGDTTLQYQPAANWLYASYNVGSNVWQGTVSSKEFLPNQWNRIEVYKKLSGATKVDGMYSIKVNNAQVLDKKDVLTRGFDFNFKQTSVLLPLMHANPGLETEITMYVDDIYLNNSKSRVELANCPVYDQCTISEIQNVTSWAENKIEISLTNKAIVDYEDMYLFVIDENGVISEGAIVSSNF